MLVGLQFINCSSDDESNDDNTTTQLLLKKIIKNNSVSAEFEYFQDANIKLRRLYNDSGELWDSSIDNLIYEYY